MQPGLPLDFGLVVLMWLRVLLVSVFVFRFVNFGFAWFRIVRFRGYCVSGLGFGLRGLDSFVLMLFLFGVLFTFVGNLSLCFY